MTPTDLPATAIMPIPNMSACRRLAHPDFVTGKTPDGNPQAGRALLFETIVEPTRHTIPKINHIGPSFQHMAFARVLGVHRLLAQAAQTHKHLLALLAGNG